MVSILPPPKREDYKNKKDYEREYNQYHPENPSDGNYGTWRYSYCDNCE